MKNSKFIIYNHTKSFEDFKIFQHITSLLAKGLLSDNETKYCYTSTWVCENSLLCIETCKTKYGYRIDVFEKKAIITRFDI